MTAGTKTFPLFDRYPLLKENLPRVSLANLPTPVQKLEGLCPGAEFNNVYMKRDDLSGNPYGGNKVRKLEFLLAEALRTGAEEIITYGCDGSNHCLSTGIYAKQLGLRSISILRVQSNAAYVQKNLLLSLYNGIELHHYETKEEMDEGAALQKKLHQEAVGKPPFEIPLGGSSPLGNVGFVNAAFELKQQIDAGELPEPDFIYLATGTLGTAAGLTVGLKVLGLKTKVMSVRVNDESRVNMESMLRQINDTYELIKSADPSFPEAKFSEDDVNFIHDFFGNAYAEFTEEGQQAVRLLDDKFGIKLEGTYTGKGFAAFLHDIDRVHSGKTLLYWNTLNSTEFPKELESVDYHDLPNAFHHYFESDVQPLDR